MDENKRFSQLEELLSNVLRAVDKLTADMQDLRKYTLENNKVVNAILHKLDDHSEQFKKDNQRFEKNDARFEKQNKRFEKHEKQFEKYEERFEMQNKRFEKRFEKHEERFAMQNKQFEERFEKHEERFAIQNKQFEERFEKHDQRVDKILEEMTAERKLRDAQFGLILKKFEKLES